MTTTIILVTAAIALLAYDPAAKLYRRLNANGKIAGVGKPSRSEAFHAAETLLGYYQSIKHTDAIEATQQAAQYLFTEVRK
jgi:hypothetical protein